MRPRTKGTISSRKRPQRIELRPVIAAACEGESEKQHLDTFSGHYKVAMASDVFKGLHGEALIDSSLSLAEAQQRKYGDLDVKVLPIAVYDLENMSDDNLAAAINAQEYATSRGVQMYLNAPTIERWFLLHFTRASSGLANTQITQQLQAKMAKISSTLYVKPGSVRFHNLLYPHAATAISNCTATHTGHFRNNNLSCFCQLVSLIASFE